jgi:hypothetical protein
LTAPAANRGSTFRHSPVPLRRTQGIGNWNGITGEIYTQ